MKKNLFILFLLLVLRSGSDACIGKVLTLGALNEPQDRLLAQTISLMINERTGTSVSLKFFDSSEQLYAAVERNEVGIVVENTERAARLLGRTKAEDAQAYYAAVKDVFRKRYNLVVLQPSGSAPPSTALYVPAVTVDVMSNFPALPRVINKLSGIMQDDLYLNMGRNAATANDPAKAVREFLRAKKFI